MKRQPKKGPEGARPPRPTSDVLDTIVRHFDDVYQQLNEHMRLIDTLRKRVNELSTKIRQT